MGGTGLRPLPISRAHDDELLQRLDVPAAVDEFDGEPVQELRVTGPLALEAEVLRRSNQPGAEELLPDSVHRHTRGERSAALRQSQEVEPRA